MLDGPMRKLVVVSISFLISACATKTQTPATNPAGCPGGDASGEWTGTGTDSAGNWAFTGSLRQQGTKLSGTLLWNNTSTGASAKDDVEGTVQCETGAMMLQTLSIANQVGTVAGTVYNGNFSPDFAKLTGTWVVGGGGTFTAAKK